MGRLKEILIFISLIMICPVVLSTMKVLPEGTGFPFWVQCICALIGIILLIWFSLKMRD